MKKKDKKPNYKIIIISLLLIFSSCEKIKKVILEEFNSERAEKKDPLSAKDLE